VVADAIVSNIEGAQSPEWKMLLAPLQDQGEQALKGRGAAVRIWTRAFPLKKPRGPWRIL
jgi:hypothetical protein